MYKIDGNTIRVEKENFDIVKTFRSGQVFRYEECGNGIFCYSSDYVAYLKEEINCIEIVSDNPLYFVNYFDLDTDYGNIVEKLSQFEISKEMEYGKGIRILKQDPFETIVSFIISQQNNIPRIQKAIFSLCRQFGEKREFLKREYYTFPDLKKLSNQNVDFLKDIKLGYRERYIYEFIKSLNNGFDLNRLWALSTDEARKELLKLLGVGRKVADCILLFAFHRLEVFPVDTWIKKYYEEKFNTKDNVTKMSDALNFEFKEYAGLIQQYIYFYIRNEHKK